MRTPIRITAAPRPTCAVKREVMEKKLQPSRIRSLSEFLKKNPISLHHSVLVEDKRLLTR